jgi:sulfide:quinone oxidoreductase
MLDRRVNFIEAEVARIDPFERKVTIAHGEVEGKLSYDYLIFALGRRLATERITGFYEHAHHLLNVDKAIQFGKAIDNFHEGHAVIGYCSGARLPVPVFETAFALSQRLRERGERERVKITVVSADSFGSEIGDEAANALRKSLAAHEIDFLHNFPIKTVSPGFVMTELGRSLEFNLLMLLPPFRGAAAVSDLGTTDPEDYINVSRTMRVVGHDRIYAAGDCVNFEGPKMGHMATRQGEVAAMNVAAEIAGEEPVANYFHEMKFVIDGAGNDGIYLHKNIGANEPMTLKHGRFWSLAKRAQKEYWEFSHS